MTITCLPVEIPGPLIIEPKVFGDARGFFFESFNCRDFQTATGLDVEFVQDNHSRSKRGVLRGLHYQIKFPQGKLVRVARGEVFDIAVDLRRSSPTFGKWAGVLLSETNYRQFWIPPGFAHGFLVLSETVDFLYKTTDYWHAEHDRSLRWDDPEIAIKWPIIEGLQLAAKDATAPVLKEAETYE